MSLMTCLAILDICIPFCLFVIVPGTVVITGIVMFIVVTIMKRKRLIADKETGLEENGSDQMKIMRIFKGIFVCIFMSGIVLWVIPICFAV